MLRILATVRIALFLIAVFTAFLLAACASAPRTSSAAGSPTRPAAPALDKVRPVVGCWP